VFITINDVKFMDRNFSDNVKNVLAYSREEAGRLHNNNVRIEHFAKKQVVCTTTMLE